MTTTQKPGEIRFENAVSQSTFVANGQGYLALKFLEGKEPKFMEMRELARSYYGSMLTLENALEIMNDRESYDTFKNVLGHGGRTYIRNPISEERNRASCLGTSVLRARLYIDAYRPFDDAVTVLILKINPDETAKILESPAENAVRISKLTSLIRTDIPPIIAKLEPSGAVEAEHLKAILRLAMEIKE